MHAMLTIVTNVCGVCLSVCLLRCLNRRQRVQCTLHTVCTGSFGAAFAKCLWPLVFFTALYCVCCTVPVFGLPGGVPRGSAAGYLPASKGLQTRYDRQSVSQIEFVS